LGIDVGLSGARAAVVDEAGRLLGRGRLVTSPLAHEAGKAERAPQEWLEAALGAARQALGEAGCREVAAIGIGALGPCPILLDGEGRPLAPAPHFSLDRRAEGHRQRLMAATGFGQNDLGPDHALPKLLWWRDHEPALIARAASVVDVTGFLVSGLTGKAVMDPITAGDYRLPGVALPVPIPDPSPADAIAGTLLPKIAARLGLGAGVPVAVGTYDSFVDVAGSGTLEPGQACIVLGSTMVLGAIVDRPTASPDMRASLHIGPGWFFSGWTSSAGNLIDWSREVLGEGDGADNLAPGAGGLLALPYFAGERAPVWDPAARGLLLGLTLNSTKAEIRRALIDGVALSARDLVARMAGVAVHRWRLAGGGARNAALAQALCDALGCPIESLAEAGEAVAPALLGFRAIGRRVEARIEATLRPDPARHEKFEALYRIYRGLYPALAASMHELGRLSSQGSDNFISAGHPAAVSQEAT
jgi:xylulokinase